MVGLIDSVNLKDILPSWQAAIYVFQLHHGDLVGTCV